MKIYMYHIHCSLYGFTSCSFVLLMEFVFSFFQWEKWLIKAGSEVDRWWIIFYSVVKSYYISHLTVIDVWIDEEVDRFYKANRKYGKDWKKVHASFLYGSLWFLYSFIPTDVCVFYPFPLNFRWLPWCAPDTLKWSKLYTQWTG